MDGGMEEMGMTSHIVAVLLHKVEMVHFEYNDSISAKNQSDIINGICLLRFLLLWRLQLASDQLLDTSPNL